MAGELNAKINRSTSIGGISFGGVASEVLYEGPDGFQKTIPAASQTDYQIDFKTTVAKNVIQAIEASVDCVVEVNSASAPAQTINLKAGQARIWQDGEPAAARIFTADVTALFVTFTGTKDCVFKVATGSDLTPA